MSNLHQLGIAFMSYNDNWDNRFMPAAGYAPTGSTRHQKSLAYLLQPYIKNKQVLLCPSAPKKLFQDNPAQYASQTDWEAPDCGWIWGGDPAPQPRSHYGNNIYTAGCDPIAGGGWGPRVPMESEIMRPTQIIYLIDARWVDLLLPGVQGRIGKAKTRHHGGSNAVFCDGHAKWMPVTKIDDIKYWNHLKN